MNPTSSSASNDPFLSTWRNSSWTAKILYIKASIQVSAVRKFFDKFHTTYVSVPMITRKNTFKIILIIILLTRQKVPSMFLLVAWPFLALAWLFF